MHWFSYGYKSRRAADLALIAAMEESQICHGTRPAVQGYITQDGRKRFGIVEHFEARDA